MKQNLKKLNSKKQSVSIEDRIQKMRLAFSNAKLENIQEKISSLGYNESKIDDYLAKVSRLEQMHRNQKKEYSEQYAETEKFNNKFEEINQLYLKHLSFCKILFKGNIQATSSLEFLGKRKRTYSGWLVQVGNFYSQLLNNSDFMDKLHTINIYESELIDVQNKIQEIIQLKEKQKKETAEAQKATKERDDFMEELHEEYNDFVAYAKIVLDQEQDLEALGIIVKR